MPRRPWGIALLFWLGLVVPGAGQEQLTWKFKEGDKFSAKIVTSSKGKVILNGDTHDQEAENTTVLAFRVLKNTADGFVLEEKIASVKGTVSGGSTGFPQIPLAPKWRGARFQITVTAQGHVTKFEGYTAALKQAAGDNEVATMRMGSLFPEDYFKQMAGAIFVPLPKGPAKKGDAWKHPAKVYQVPWGLFEAANRYVDDGKSKEGHRITLTAAMKYVAPPGDAADPPLKVMSGQLKAQPLQGTILFDPAAGRLLRRETKVQFKGTLVFTSEDRKNTILLEREQTVAIRLQN